MTMPGAAPDGRAPLRIRDLKDGPVPAVPWSAGSGLMVGLSVVIGLLGLAFLILTFFSAAPLAHLAGVADSSTAVVTEKTYKKVGFSRRGSAGCDFYRFDVAWDGREGLFTVCDNPDLALSRLEVGDELVIRSVPWASEVTPVDSEGKLFWAVTGLIAGVWLVWLGAVWVVRYRRLVRGGATGVLLSGGVTAHFPTSMSVQLETPGLANRRLLMLPAGQPGLVAAGEPAEIWSSRRSLILRRPRGPWVVRIQRSEIVFTHAWLRDVKSIYPRD